MIRFANILIAPSSNSTLAQRIARRLMVSGCLVIALSVTIGMTASALEKQPATHFVETSPSLAAMASTGKPVSKKTSIPASVELRATSRVVRMNVTAYCPCTKCCGKNAAGITASGKPISVDGGRFVAAPGNYAFGTQLLIQGYNGGQTVKVLDRGGAIKGNHLDVFFPTHDQAKAWGRRMIDVTVAD